MAELVFDCVEARAERYAMSPSLSLGLRITETAGEPVDAIALRCQIRVEPQRRRYSAEEAERLHDLFGDPDRWADTLKPLQFAMLSTMVPGFRGATTIDLQLPCSYDMEIAATKYFNGLTDGAIPLLLLFSGTVFATREGRLAVQQIPWSKEASFPLPVSVWRETIDLHYPNTAWVPVRRETLDALQRFKSSNALPTWDSTLAALLERLPDGPKESTPC